MKFLIVDAFTETLFGGNPAGIVLLPDGADFPSDELCVKTAAELRYSETAFIQDLGNNEFKIRYFTPAAEVESLRPRDHRLLLRSSLPGPNQRQLHLHQPHAGRRSRNLRKGRLCHDGHGFS